MKLYKIVVKNNNEFTILNFLANDNDEATIVAQNHGEIVHTLESEEVGFDTTIDYQARMLDYYPEVIKSILEFQTLIETQSVSVDEMHEELNKILDNAYVSSADTNTINQWERTLGITPQSGSTLSDRKETILARLCATPKLNSAYISQIVRIFTGGSAESYFKDGTIYVYVTPPYKSKSYNFENIKQELEKKLPAHLKVSISLSYRTWNEVKTDFPTWDDVKTNNAIWDKVLHKSIPNIGDYNDE